MSKYLFIIIIFAIKISFAEAQVNLNQGLVAYYPFSGNFNDASGNNLNLSAFNGVQLTTDELNNNNSACYFDGIDDYLQILNNPLINFTDGMSIALNFYPESNAMQTLVGKINFTQPISTQYQLGFGYNAKPGVYLGVNPLANGCTGLTQSLGYVNTGSVIATHQWYCIVSTFDKGIMKIYLNGCLVQTIDVGFTNLNQCADANLRLGMWWTGDSQMFKGKMDNVRIYNRALNREEAASLCGGSCPDVTCNNWLKTPSNPSYVTAGDLDITGNKLTVEALFNRSSPLTNGIYYGHLVSKHIDPSNVNYALLPNGCEITTDISGYKSTFETCPLELDKTHHVAMVYDGATLKYYRDGFLFSQVPCTGNLINNNFETTIGIIAGIGYPDESQFRGLINEVRIWNVARTQDELKTYMNSSLPNPTTQAGLKGYFTFDNLINKQGNAAFNGTLHGGASINQTNPKCTLVRDSCKVKTENICRSSFGNKINNNSRVLINPNGSGSYNQLYNTNGFTWESWFKLTSPITNRSLIISTEDDVLFHDIFLGFGWGSIPNALSFNVSDNGILNTITVESSQNLSVNKWYHVAAVCDYNNSILKLYLDGTLIATKAIPASIVNNRLSTNHITQIGNASAKANGINADIDEVRFWSTVRTQQEIQNNMHACMTMPQTGLVAYFKADEASGSDTYSEADANFTGTLESSTWSAQTTEVNCPKIAAATTAGSTCSEYFFTGSSDLDDSKIQSWQWYFDNIQASTTKATTYTFSNSGTHVAKLVVIDINGCKDSVEMNVSSTTNNFDFYYEQDICNPLTVHFYNSGQTIQNPYWSFGDGASTTNHLTPVHTYSNYGNYPVKFSVKDGTCNDTIVKLISINIIKDDIILTKDTTICTGTKASLRTIPALNFCWSPTTYLDDPNAANPATSTPVPITYYFTAKVPGINLISNGSFNAGNTGFTSAYSYASNNTTEGQYFIGNNPVTWNALTANCKDHTGNSGNMMLVNGSSTPDQNVWTHTISVSPNTNYAFATWIQSLYPANPAQLKFSINNNDVGSLITAPSSTCTWQQFYTTWNSGNNTSAIISIVNKNTVFLGNDFALDDISFAPLVIKTDSVKINIETPVVTAINDTSVCPDQPLQLNASGAVNYIWSPATGLSNPSIANPVAITSSNIQYTVTGTTAAGCIANDVVNINMLPALVIKTNPDTSVCEGQTVQLNTTGANTYTWSPANNLSNTNTANPVATVLSYQQYIVSGTDLKGCVGKDTVIITIRPKPVISILKDTAICNNGNVQLYTSGGVNYQWSPAVTLDNPTIANPIATPSTPTTYFVTVTDANTCTNTDSVKISFRPNPVFTINPNSTICGSTPFRLNASGGDKYQWSPANLVDNPAISNPVATTSSTTNYTVVITESKCNLSSTLTTTLTVSSVLEISAEKSNDINCTTGSANLFASGGTKYEWTPATGLNNASIANPVASPSTTQRYIVKGSNNAGCVGYDTVTVYANFGDPSLYYMPSTFTPNEDGLNDCYRIKYWGAIRKLEFSIYNRWGERVFYTKNPAECWDGRYKGQPAEAGAYVFQIKASTTCGDVNKKGTVILAR